MCRWYPKTQRLWFFEYGTRDNAHCRDDRGRALCNPKIYVPPFKLPGVPLITIYKRHAGPCAKCVLIISNQEKDVS